MRDAEMCNLPLEKIGLALVTAAKKLPQYFQAHIIYMVTQYSIQAMFKRADFTGQISKWGAKIGILDVKYLSRTAIKGQMLADFITEFTPVSGQEMPNIPTCDQELIEDTSWWRLYVDGAPNAKRVGTRVVIITPDGAVIEQSIWLDFKASNNKAEYEAILARLNLAKTLGAQNLLLHYGFLLVTSQINGE